MKSILVLADGRSFTGQALGVEGESMGEVILNTAVVGYQEMLTDPANAGKLLVLTYPLIGNYGVAEKFNESGKVWPCGLVIKENSRLFSNWQAEDSLDNFIQKHKLLAMAGVDTRTLAVHLRQKGQMPGIISTRSDNPKELLSKIQAFAKKEKPSLLPRISVQKPRYSKNGKVKYKIAVLDLGLTKSVIRQLHALGCALTILPYNTKPQDILRFRPQGLIISGGPEEDAGLAEVADNVRGLIQRLPILGVATGLQVLGRALGVKITRMKLGHHGVNYPMENAASYKGEITVQNHSYALDMESLNRIKAVKVTGYNLNDRTVEEIESGRLKIIGVQYNPASPGFAEINPVFPRFLKMLGRSR